MAYICLWSLEKRVLPKLVDNLRYSFEEFHSLWNVKADEDPETLELKELIKQGEEVFGLYFLEGKDDPVCMSQIVGLFNKEEYRTFINELSFDAKVAASKHEVQDSVWVEKDFKFVNKAIREFISDLEEYQYISHFDKEGYEKFLEAHGLSYETITKDTIVNPQKALGSLFIEKEDIKKIFSNLKRKKNVIFQGPPGVGKTFIIKNFVDYAVGVKKSKRVQMVQFHQSYSYEDFVQGYKPEEGGGFKLKNGVFYEFCKRAQKDPSFDYYFIIDEINRGNLSKIFGELLMLIEVDKRGPEYAIPLTYSDEGEMFYVPENVYIIGLMNTADRSLAVVDYALRRRFAFITMKPNFGKKFVAFLKEKGISEEFIYLIVDKITALNKVIEDDPNLGAGFLIGHSYFCSNISLEGVSEVDWYHDIIENDIAPTLEEYWYDDLAKAQDEIENLYFK